MPAKRKYTLSDAARAQRVAANRARHGNRTTGPEVLSRNITDLIAAIQEYQSSTEEFGAIPDIFAKLPKDAPHSEHQRRAALIRVRQIRNGTLKGSPGGRDRVPRPCPRCNVECDSAREARDHCRVARK